MAICPNCGANIGINSKCPHCGSLLNNENSNHFIKQLKDVTGDFSHKPTCNDEVFQEIVVQALTTASVSELSIYQERIIAYTHNYLIGGTGIVNNPYPTSYLNTGEVPEGRYLQKGFDSRAVSFKRIRRKIPKAKLALLLTCVIGGLAVIVGTSVGVPLGVRATKEKQKNERTSEVSLYSNYPEGSYMYSSSYVYGHTNQEYGVTKSLSSYQCPSDVNGYRFLGYYKTRDTAYDNDQVFDREGNALRAWDYYGGKVNLYGQWERTSVVLYLSTNGGTGGPTSISADVNETLPRISPLPTKTGYRFNGYYSGAFGGTKYYDQNGYGCHVCDLEHEDFLYAQWAAKKISVNFDKQGGSGGTSDISATYDDDMPTILVPTKSGYDFAGYYDSTSDGTQYFDEKGVNTHICDLSDNSYLYARWAAKSTKVLLDANGGTGGTTAVDATYNDDMPSIIIPSKEGYSFSGYYTSTSGGTKYYDAYGDSYRECDFTSELTLYAQWSVNSYTISLNKNGGSGGSNSVSATYDATMPSIYSLPSRTGYTFLGYFTSSSGGTQYYDAYGNGLRLSKFNSATTLYAHWEARQVNITLNQNNGSGGLNNIVATYDSHMPTLYSLPTRAGYSFNGYFSSTSGGTKYYNADGSSARLCNYTYTSTLYAQWSAVQSTITFNKNGGTGGTNSTVCYYNSSMPYISTPVRSGYYFNGYYSSLTGGIKYYDDYGYSVHTCDLVANATLFAQWLPQYTITFNANGGSGGTSSIVVTKDLSLPSVYSLPTRTGYTFNGFYNRPSGGTQYYNSYGSGTVVCDFDSDTTLYAQWTPVTPYVTLNRNGGSGGSSYVYATYDSPMPSISVPTRSNYYFNGYFTSTSGGIQYYDHDGHSTRNCDFTSSKNLYAQWLYKATVTLNRNSGTGGTSSVVAIYSFDMPTIEVPTRTGYTFTGYYTSSGGGTKYYNADGTSAHTYDYSYSITLYAQWVLTNYTITFDKSEGTGGTNSVSANYGYYPPSISVPSRYGYTFNGYYTSPSGGTQYYNSSGSSTRSFNLTTDLTLFAQWTRITASITLNRNGGSGGTSSVTAYYGDDMPTITIPTKYGYRFTGYYTSSSGGTQYYNSDGTSTRVSLFSSSTTLYAHWSPISSLVAFDKGGGIGGTDDTTATYGEYMSSVSVPTKEKHLFNGYYSSNNVQYFDNDGVCVRACDFIEDITLYARWLAVYTITFDAGEGSGGTSVLDVVEGESMSNISIPTRLGYYFEGYYTEETGGMLYFDYDGTAVHTNDLVYDTTMYAHWTQVNATITLDKSGGSGGTDDVLPVYGAEMPTITIPSRTGYNFDGYYDSISGGTKYYNNDGTSAHISDFTSDTTLFARWAGIDVSILFDMDDGTGGSSNTIATYGIDMPSITIPTKVGWVFEGYFTEVSGGTQYYSSTGFSTHICDFLTETTLYAHWSELSVTITLNKNNGSGGTNSVYVAYGANMPTISVPTRAGYTFDGYFTSTSGGTKYYNSDGTSAHVCDFTTNTTTLYAQWTYITPYTVANTGSYGFTLSSGVYQSNNYHINSSTAQMTVTFQVSGTVSYQYKVSSESGFDKLYVSVNGSYVANGISGSGSWVTRSATVSKGSTIVVRYTKDSSVHSNSDRGYFQILSFTAS